MPTPAKPRSVFVEGLAKLDATDTRKRLALTIAAAKAASIECNGVGDGPLMGTLWRVEDDLRRVARQSIMLLAEALAEHEAWRAAPPAEPEPEPPVVPVRVPRLPPSP